MSAGRGREREYNGSCYRSKYKCLKEEKMMKTRIAIIALLMAPALLLGGCASVVSPGEMGLKWRPVTSGLSDKTLMEGFYVHMPWNDIVTFSLQWRSFSERVDVLTRDDLHIRVDVSVIARPVPAELYQLQLDVGPDFYRNIIKPVLLTTVRGAMAEYQMVEIPEKSREIETRVLESMKQYVRGKHLEVDNLTINHIEFTKRMLQAIETKLAKEQEKDQKVFEREIAFEDAEIERIQAKGEADSLKIKAVGQAEAQKIIDGTLTERFLQFKAFDSPNAKFIYVPLGSDGLPIIVTPKVE